MSTVYATEIASAAVDIAAAGTAVTFSRNSPTVDPTTGEPNGAGPLTASTVAIGVKSNWQKFAALGLTLNFPQTIKAAASGMAFAPQPGDSFVWGGFLYAVVNVETLEPDGTAILFTIVGNR